MSLEQRQHKDLVLYSPKNCYKHSSKLKSIKDVLSIPSKTMGRFKRDYGKDWVIGYLSMWLIDLNDNAQVKTKMRDSQIEFTAERIYESYSLTVADITFFFRNIKEGVYGPYYENISSEKIMEWLRQYFDMRCEYAQMHSQSGHDTFSINKDRMDAEVAKELFKGVGEVKIDHRRTGGGLGSRVKAKVIKNQVDFMTDMLLKVKESSDEQLKEYLLLNDKSSDLYDERIYEMVEKEIDFRNEKLDEL